MEPNRDFASILEQAAIRRVDVVYARFDPNPDTTDHSGLAIDYEVRFDQQSKKEPVKNVYTIQDADYKKKVGTILGELLGPERENTKSSADRKRFLDGTVEKLLNE